MKMTYHLPAHPSCLTDGDDSAEEVEKAVSLFRFLVKPDKLGEIPESFVFLIEPGKTVGPVFDSKEMNSPDEKTEERWIKNTMQLAWGAQESYVRNIMDFLEGGRKPRKEQH